MSDATPPTRCSEVLMIANDFPPIGGAGVQRSLYFAKYLPEHGWHPTVLTVKEVAFPAKDPTLLDALPPEVRVLRTESLELRRLLWLGRRLTTRRRPAAAVDAAASAHPADAANVGRRWRELARGLRRWLFVPDDRILWTPFAVVAGLRHARRHPVKVIYTTVPAYSCGVIGLLVSRLSGLPLVLDLRDPWTRDPYQPAPTRLHARLNALLEKAAIRRSSHLVVISEEMRRRFEAAYPQLDERRIRVITNGYDAATFEAVEPLDHGDRFVVAYVGSLYAHHRQVLRAACRAWDRAAQTDAGFARHAELEIVGRCDPEIVDELSSWPRVRSRRVGYQSHRRASAHLLGASALLLLIKDLDPDRDLVTIPGKLFDYLGAGPPILMIGPQGDAAEIVRSTGGRVLQEGDVEATCRALVDLFRHHADIDAPRALKASPRGRFERRALTADLAAILDEAATGGSMP